MSHGTEVPERLRLSVNGCATGSSLLLAVVNLNIDLPYSGSQEEEEI